MTAFSKTFDDAEAVLLAGLAHDPNPLFLAGAPPLLSPVVVAGAALAVLSRAQPAKLPSAIEFEVTGPLPARGTTIEVDITTDVAPEHARFAAHNVRGAISLRRADHADRPLRPLPPVLLPFRKLVTETDILLACGLTGDVHPWHLQDVAALGAGLAARPMPALLLLNVALARCIGSANGHVPRRGALTIHQLPVLGNELRFARTGEGSHERVAVVIGEHVVAETQFEFGGAAA